MLLADIRPWTVVSVLGYGLLAWACLYLVRRGRTATSTLVGLALAALAFYFIGIALLDNARTPREAILWGRLIFDVPMAGALWLHASLTHVRVKRTWRWLAIAPVYGLALTLMIADRFTNSIFAYDRAAFASRPPTTVDLPPGPLYWVSLGFVLVCLVISALVLVWELGRSRRFSNEWYRSLHLCICALVASVGCLALAVNYAARVGVTESLLHPWMLTAAWFATYGLVVYSGHEDAAHARQRLARSVAEVAGLLVLLFGALAVSRSTVLAFLLVAPVLVAVHVFWSPRRHWQHEGTHGGLAAAAAPAAVRGSARPHRRLRIVLKYYVVPTAVNAIGWTLTLAAWLYPRAAPAPYPVPAAPVTLARASEARLATSGPVVRRVIVAKSSRTDVLFDTKVAGPGDLYVYLESTIRTADTEEATVAVRLPGDLLSARVHVVKGPNPSVFAPPDRPWLYSLELIEVTNPAHLTLEVTRETTGAAR